MRNELLDLTEEEKEELLGKIKVLKDFNLVYPDFLRNIYYNSEYILKQFKLKEIFSKTFQEQAAHEEGLCKLNISNVRETFGAANMRKFFKEYDLDNFILDYYLKKLDLQYSISNNDLERINWITEDDVIEELINRHLFEKLSKDTQVKYLNKLLEDGASEELILTLIEKFPDFENFPIVILNHNLTIDSRRKIIKKFYRQKDLPKYCNYLASNLTDFDDLDLFIETVVLENNRVKEKRDNIIDLVYRIIIKKGYGFISTSYSNFRNFITKYTNLGYINPSFFISLYNRNSQYCGTVRNFTQEALSNLSFTEIYNQFEKECRLPQLEKFVNSYGISGELKENITKYENNEELHPDTNTFIKFILLGSSEASNLRYFFKKLSDGYSWEERNRDVAVIYKGLVFYLERYLDLFKKSLESLTICSNQELLLYILEHANDEVVKNISLSISDGRDLLGINTDTRWLYRRDVIDAAAHISQFFSKLKIENQNAFNIDSLLPFLQNPAEFCENIMNLFYKLNDKLGKDFKANGESMADCFNAIFTSLLDAYKRFSNDEEKIQELSNQFKETIEAIKLLEAI